MALLHRHHHPTTAVSPQAPDYRKPPPNRPLPPPLPPLPLPSPRPLNAPPLRRRPRPRRLLRHCSPRSHENPRPNLLEPTQVDDNDQVLVRVQGPCFHYGEYWRQMRSICVLQLLSNRRVQSFRDVREEETAVMIEKIRSSGSDVVNLSELMVELTGDVDVFAGGTETTSTSLEWAMAELLNYPQVMKKLKIEIRLIAQPNQPITEDDLDQMPYLKAVIKETLRLHPPIPSLMPRESTKDVQVMGYDIATGTRVVTNAWAIGRDPSSWDEPEEFRPERFLNSSVDFRGHDFELIPFGAGRRGCPGIQFAAVVNELAFANLVHKFDFAVPDGVEFDMSEAAGFSVRKMHPLLVVATPRTC
ncbi:hypothetical protein RHGRI_031514 [Rhododendron griersonianum]|uniref:Uncharacterized protein n=1 Tax=Rhododendron griersonianum TaxID=479676 RepID=A0AAV6I8K0_9ERIC|nr:hypothetical protein RHGRI_031514 [Rhododendron griersonianum]